MKSGRLILFLLSILLGLVSGLYYGWVMNPVKAGESKPAELRADYRADLVLMVAEIYQKDGDAARAAELLKLLGNDPPARLVQQAILTAGELKYSNNDVELLVRLSQALLESGAGQKGTGLILWESTL